MQTLRELFNLHRNCKIYQILLLNIVIYIRFMIIQRNFEELYTYIYYLRISLNDDVWYK